MTAFRPSRWLPGAHLQTIVGHRVKGGSAPARRERWDTPDGDFLDIDWFDQGLPADAPMVLLIHGLGGSSASSYIQLSAQLLRARGVRPVAMNCRGATGPNRTMRLHHAGEWEDPAFVAARLREQTPALGVLGFSLGGSMTLNLVARQAAADAAATISAPLDLDAGSAVLERGFSKVYTRYLLSHLQPQLDAFAYLAAAGADIERARAATTMRAFDDAFTAPLHGFAGAADYYARSSAGPRLGAVEVPTLVVRAADDPFLCRTDLRFLDAASSHVEARVTPGGGHVGFVSGPPWRLRHWAEETATAWLADRLRR